MILSLAFSMTVRAQYVIKQADTMYRMFNYMKAIELYKQAYQKKKTLHAAGRLAECYSLVRNYAEAENWCAITISMPESRPEDIIELCKGASG